MKDRIRIKNEQLGGGVTDNTGISWLFCMNLLMAKLDKYEIDAEEKKILRGLARQTAFHANEPIQEQRIRLWKDHLSLKETRPLVFIDPELAWYEILPHTALQCRHDLARVWEYRLRKEIFWQEKIKDDRVCRKEFSVQDVVVFSDFGIPLKRTGGENGGAYCIEPVIEDYDRDLGRLHFRNPEIDRDRSARLEGLADEVFDGILRVVKDNSWWYSAGLTVDLIHLRGFENFMCDIYEYPDELKALMSFLRDDWLHMLDFLEKNSMLSLNNGGEFMGTGGYGWCDDLPSPGFDPAHVRPADMWGYGESQESVSISPDSFAEFVLPYQIPILERFGLNSYGCCEPLDNRIDLITRAVPRLRKVSVSPWSNLRFMAEKLGKNYVYCWKMNPAILAVKCINEDAIRREFRETFAFTRAHGCPTEVLMRDVLTLAFKEENAIRWARIAMEEAEQY